MEWLNLHTSVLDSSAFIGSDPVGRATWLCLMRYCIGQENGGRIEGARGWGDRKWQQLVRVTLKEIQAESELWSWDGEALVAFMYPSDKEDEVKNRRENARQNGMLGGRPRKTNVTPPAITHEEPTLVNSGKAEGKGNGKGMEGEAKHRSPRGEPADEKEFMSKLAASPAYQGIDLMREHAKMVVWCENRRVKPSRSRFINWLNRCEKPMSGQAGAYREKGLTLV